MSAEPISNINRVAAATTAVKALIFQLEGLTPEDLKALRSVLHESTDDFALPASERHLYKDFVRLVETYRRRTGG